MNTIKIIISEDQLSSDVMLSSSYVFVTLYTFAAVVELLYILL